MNIDLIEKIVAELGFRPTRAGSENINFMFEGGHYFLDVDPEDPMYVRIGYPRFWLTNNDTERIYALRFASEATSKIKVAKVFFENDQVNASVEQYLASEETLKITFMRCLRALQGSAKYFSTVMTAATKTE